MIRKAKYKDVQSIFNLINFYSSRGQILHCSVDEIANRIGDFVVYEIEEEIISTCSLKFSWDDLVEIRSLAVHPSHYRQRVATSIINACIKEVQQHREIIGVFVLTYAVSFFLKLGFEIIPKNTLPLKVWEDCMSCFKRENCDETAMFRELKSTERSLPILSKPIASSF